MEAVPRLVKNVSNLSVKEQPPDHGDVVDSSLQLSSQIMQNSSDTPTIIDELFKVPTRKDSGHGTRSMCTGNSASDDSFQYRRTAKVSKHHFYL